MSAMSHLTGEITGEIVVFAGPTVRRAEIEARCPGCTVLAPAALGDVTRAARRRPRAIAIIDGVFERRPAVYHKEILWAMSEGVQVFGAASMGALRAAELGAFGMIGVGRIHQMFVDGEIDADDEVAVAHGTAEFDHRSFSEALVNIRATMTAAVDAGIVRPESAAALVKIAQSMFYPARVWPAVITAAEDHVPADELDALREWLPTGRVDQKALDAHELLDVLAALDRTTTVRRPDFEFSRTHYWDDIEAAVDGGSVPLQSAGVDDVLEELRLDPDRYLELAARARGHALGLALADQFGFEADDADTAEEITAWRTAHGLEDTAGVQSWLADHGVATDELVRLARERVRARWSRMSTDPRFSAALVDQLVFDGAYRPLADRAATKRLELRERGLEAADDPTAVGIDDSDLFAAFVATNRRFESSSLETVAATLDFRNQHELIGALRRAHLAGGADADDAVTASSASTVAGGSRFGVADPQ